MSKKTLILPLAVVYTLIDETEGVGEHFYKFPQGPLTFNEVLRIQKDCDWNTIFDKAYSEEEFDTADGGASDANSIGIRLLNTLTEKGLTLSAVLGLGGNLLYKKSNSETKDSFVATFVGKNPNYANWENRVGRKFAECAFDVSTNSEEYNFIMDELEQSVFDETIDYVTPTTSKEALTTLPCVVVVFDKKDEE